MGNKNNIVDLHAKVKASTAISKPYSELKARLQESLSIEQLISEHTWESLPDIESLIWEGHMQPLPPIVLVDMDHTLAHSSWRDGMIGNAPWDEYHRWGCHDRPVKEMCALIESMSTNALWKIVGITGRPESFRAMTMKWLVDNRLHLDELMMRDDNDYRPNAKMKVEMCREKFGTPLSKHISFIIDDNEDICSAFRAEGVTTLQVSIRRTE